MAQTAKKPILLPVRGLDVSAPAEFIDPSGASAIQNIEINRNIIRKRTGTTALGASLGERVMAYNELREGDGNYLFRFGPTTVQILNKAASTWSNVTGTPLTGVSTDVYDFAFPILNGRRIMTFTNGVDNIRKITGASNAADLGGAPPKCKYMVAYQGYLILGHIFDAGSVFSSELVWCDTAAPENWTTGNSGSAFLVADGEDITGMGLSGPYFTVHMESSISLGYGVTTSDVFRVERKNTGIGTAAHQTIKNIPNGGQIFLALDGVHIFDGNAAPLVQSKIVDEIREGINPSYIRQSSAIVVRELDEYWLAVPMGSETVPETIYKYNYRTGDWYKDNRPNLTAISTYVATDETPWDSMVGTWDAQTERWDSVTMEAANPLAIFGDSTGVSTRRALATASDNTTAIDAYYTTKDFTAEDFGLETGRLIRWKGLQVWAKGDFVDVEYSTDGGTSWVAVDTITLESDYPADDAPAHAWFDVVASGLRLRFSNDTVNETFTLKKFYIEATPREMRK